MSVNHALAKSGVLALAAASVAFGYLYLRRRFTIDPSQVYHLAMYRLNTHPGLLEASCAAPVAARLPPCLSIYPRCSQHGSCWLLRVARWCE